METINQQNYVVHYIRFCLLSAFSYILFGFMLHNYDVISEPILLRVSTFDLQSFFTLVGFAIVYDIL